jgi:ABC-type branched-subunit amino acid transport system ATPase component
MDHGGTIVPRSESSIILDVRDILKSFGAVRALDHVSLHLRAGEILGLIGPNGAGKSVLQHCIGGNLAPDDGEIWIDGVKTNGWSPERLCRHGVSRTFQIPRPFGGMTAYKTALVGASFGPASRTERRLASQRAHEALRFVNFIGSPDTPVRTLNTAQLKRIDLARAIACQPRLLMIDEVASGLTSDEVDEMVRIVRQIARNGAAIIMVEHIVRSILDACDRAVVLDRGRVIAEGLPHDVMANPAVIAAYLGPRRHTDA